MKNKLLIIIGQRKWIIYLIALFVGFSMGTIVPLATTHMTQLNTSNIWIGIISSSFFLLMAFGSIYVDRNIRGKDVTNSIVIGLLLTAGCAVVFPLFNSYLIWLLLMSLMGLGISLNLVGMQTAMHSLSGQETRAVVSGIYSFCFAIGFVLSAVSGPVLYEIEEWIPFMIASFALLFSSLFIYVKLKGVLIIPSYPEEKVFHRVKLPLAGAFTYGFVETTVISLYPLFLILQGFEITKIGYALGFFIVGSIIGTIPITYLADRIGREKCFSISVFMSIIAIVGVMTFTDFTGILIFSFVCGFVVGPLYPLTLALTVQDLNERELHLVQPFSLLHMG